MSLKACLIALAAGAAAVAAQSPASANISASQLDRFYPPAARAAGVSGYVVLECYVNQDESLGGCQVVEESPGGYGFGEASLKAVRTFKADFKTADGAPVPGQGLKVRIPIRWTLEHAAGGGPR
jgi:protein TonB